MHGQLRCVISGSFRKHFDDIQSTISEFEKLGVTVLAPHTSEALNPTDEFVLLKQDTTSDIKFLEEQHLQTIRESDFLYVYNPEGYTGKSTVLEIGFALACGKRVYCLEIPDDIVIQRFVTGTGRPDEILSMV